MADGRGTRDRCARDAKGERKAVVRGAWRSAAFAQRSPQPFEIITGSVRKDGGVSNTHCPKLLCAVRRAWCARTEGPRSGSRQPIRSRGPREGRRPDERPGRGRRHLADNSQVSDKAARRTEGSGGFERTAFQDAFASFKRKIGRFSKTLAIISLKPPWQSLHVIRGQGQSPALSAFCASKPSNLESLTRGGRFRKSGRLEPALCHFPRLWRFSF